MGRRLPDYHCFACGQTFRTYAAEAKHRHNFPVLCRKNAQFERFMAARKEGEKAEFREGDAT
ncbi:hypothetical protein [Sagittula salina]|uniref:Uncharacterized protein n=1 Tax=Sagittula salina TaxID=2820268 RepID=A0A940MLE3_9RHOB|nr:hypothetical protein [Sagittula salina]MBP0483970.1 hypothetical protein [Sagittula salina]